MKNIQAPEDAQQPVLFDAEDHGWWAAHLDPSALRALRSGWQGIFHRSLLKLMPAERIGEKFSAACGRPTKELYSVLGLLLIAELRHLTGEQAAEACSFDASVHFALNLPRDGQYLSARSADNYRHLLRQDDHAQAIFQSIDRAHVADEYVEIDQVEQALEFQRRMLMSFE